MADRNSQSRGFDGTRAAPRCASPVTRSADALSSTAPLLLQLLRKHADTYLFGRNRSSVLTHQWWYAVSLPMLRRPRTNKSVGQDVVPLNDTTLARGVIA